MLFPIGFSPQSETPRVIDCLPHRSRLPSRRDPAGMSLSFSSV